MIWPWSWWGATCAKIPASFGSPWLLTTCKNLQRPADAGQCRCTDVSGEVRIKFAYASSCSQCYEPSLRSNPFPCESSAAVKFHDMMGRCFECDNLRWTANAFDGHIFQSTHCSVMKIKPLQGCQCNNDSHLPNASYDVPTPVWEAYTETPI